jgi:hypothetical protein
MVKNLLRYSYRLKGVIMSKTFTDFSEKGLSLTTAIIFLVIGIYDVLVLKNYIRGTKLVISGIILFSLFFIIKKRLYEKKKKEFRAGYGLVVIGSFIKVFGAIGAHIIWILGIFLLISSVKNEK